MMRFPLNSLMAAALPISFLWLFAACVLICERKGADTHGRPVISSLVEAVDVKGAPDCGECPVTPFPTATAPERAALKFNSPAPPAAPTSILTATSPPGGVHSVLPYFYPPSAAPPLDRLFALRI
jgi:hypothetical protein